MISREDIQLVINYLSKRLQFIDSHSDSETLPFIFGIPNEFEDKFSSLNFLIPFEISVNHLFREIITFPANKSFTINTHLIRKYILDYIDWLNNLLYEHNEITLAVINESRIKARIIAQVESTSPFKEKENLIEQAAEMINTEISKIPDSTSIKSKIARVVLSVYQDSGLPLYQFSRTDFCKLIFPNLKLPNELREDWSWKKMYNLLPK